jgi:L-fuconolactonase
MHTLRIDAHQHFWDYTRHAADYVWMGPDDGVLKRNFLPADLAPLLAQSNFSGTVAVQARELPQETRFLLDLAAASPLILGVVGWLDLCDPDIAPTLEALAAEPKLKGLRMLIHDRADLGFADSPAHVRGVALAQRHGLTYDLLLRPPHIAPATRLVDLVPQQRFVVDHLAKPRIGDSFDAEWARGMRDLARRPNVFCKLSGLPTLLPAGRFQIDALRPYLDTVLHAFGPARCMTGSDWPVCTLGADYASTMGLVTEWAQALSPIDRDDILGRTCARFYRLQATDL